jgi:hypothetical protein
LSYKKKVGLLISISTVIRLAVAASIGLGNDEVYYRIYAQYLHWNYFDHPPMVAWLTRITTLNLTLDNEVFIRFGAIICAGICTWLLFLAGKKLVNEYTGYLAALIYTATIYGSIIAGTFMLPDSPQMVCWTAALYLLIDIAGDKSNEEVKKRKLLWFGIVAGVGMLCKIHTVFLWLGLLLYLLRYDIKWFRKPVLYISGIITILFFVPVIKWNIDNHFVTFLYHSERVSVSGAPVHLPFFLTFMGGQVFYYNPVIFVLIIITTIAAFRNKLPVARPQQSLLLLCSLPLIGISIAISLFREVLPHWTGPAYTGLILLTASFFGRQKGEAIALRPAIPRVLKIANLVAFMIVVYGALVINYFPGTMGKKKMPQTGDRDFTLEMYGWKRVEPVIAGIIKQDEQKGLMKKDAVFISNKWFPASHIDYYIAMPLKKDVIAIGDTSDIHQYAWINKERKKLVAGDDAYCIVPSEYYIDVHAEYQQLFTSVLTPDTIWQKRSGETCRLLYVYRLKNYKGKM